MWMTLLPDRISTNIFLWYQNLAELSTDNFFQSQLAYISLFIMNDYPKLLRKALKFLTVFSTTTFVE